MRGPGVPISRRSFIGGAVGVAASVLVPRSLYAAGSAKPDSSFNGVQIGAITYSYRSMPSSAEELLGYLVRTCTNSNDPVQMVPTTGPHFIRWNSYN